MIITNYTNFLNEAETTQPDVTSTQEEKTKISEDVIVNDISTLMKKLKEKNNNLKSKSDDKGELIIGQKYTYKPEDADAYNITLSGITDKEYICIKEKDGGSVSINKSRKSQFTKIETKEEPKTSGITLGNVYNYEYEPNKNKRYLIVSEVEDSDGKRFNAQNIDSNQVGLKSISVSNIRQSLGDFTKVMTDKINNSSFDKKDLIQWKNVKSIVDKFNEEWWKSVGKNHNENETKKLVKLINDYITPLEKENPKKEETTNNQQQGKPKPTNQQQNNMNNQQQGKVKPSNQGNPKPTNKPI
jgi:hypothetical protein